MRLRNHCAADRYIADGRGVARHLSGFWRTTKGLPMTGPVSIISDAAVTAVAASRAGTSPYASSKISLA